METDMGDTMARGADDGTENDYVTRVFDDPRDLDRAEWNALLPPDASPFVRHEYLCALHASGSATPDTGWTPAFLTLWQGAQLQAASPLYLKMHSYGEYVFDWAWANAYAQHGLDYYPKALVAVPFTPVPGARLLARTDSARLALALALRRHCETNGLSSLHLLFLSAADRLACEAAGFMGRQTVQFHFQNRGFTDFEHFLSSLNQEKRKKIRQERRKVAEAGVHFRWARGADISAQDWAFFYRCYERTYLEHGNAPYLTPSFFDSMAREMADHWLLFVAHGPDGEPMACSLIALSDGSASPAVAYGRYWGALRRVDCLHFEACYYQPLMWCLQHGVQRFEGGAQGEHKMARALMPVSTHSAHWLAHPAFAQAVERFLQREGSGVEDYLEHLAHRNPFRREPVHDDRKA